MVSLQYGRVNLVDSIGYSTYHSLQAHVTKRSSQGLSGQFSYTFSKALGLDSDNNIRDLRNLATSKGVLTSDRTHVIASSVAYELPFGRDHLFFKNAPGWADRLIGGWQLSTITQWQSGAPLNFTYPLGSGVGTLYNTASNTFDQVGQIPQGEVVKGNGFVSFFPTLTTQRAPQPNFGGDTSLPGVFTNQVVKDASGNVVFQNAAPGTVGNMNYYASNIRGPGLLSFNAAMKKTIRITEGKTFTLGVDAVNVLNKPQWGNPSVNVNGSTFGRITTVVGNAPFQRQVILTARIDF